MSLGNTVDPLDVAGRYGADVLRLWAAASDTNGDVRFSAMTMQVHQESLRKLRNALRYLLGNLAERFGEAVPYAELEEPKRWVLGRLEEVGGAVRAAALDFDFGGML